MYCFYHDILMRNIGKILAFGLIFAQIMQNNGLSAYVLQTFSGSIGAGNYTYYKLTRQGPMVLHLTTTQGDADIYISSETLSPTFENYDIQSVTCGDDIIQVTTDLKRPIGVGVYGHPAHETSKYKLSLYTGYEDDTYQPYSYSDADDSDASKDSSKDYNGMPGKNSFPLKDDEESLFYTIVINILKIIFDILL
ncbi:unnamed protein product [Owenia fusiformis]|uniref:Uncharacterized protein n=1 Tax=Owenia fusiformis TaxID=6347 RepID=A0A8J1U4G8_OWEFU|nr:unnamed protein product [Owenia fusiformis]